MRITIKRSDWKPGIDYYGPCGCLLARAIKRQLKTRQATVWMSGAVQLSDRAYRYSVPRNESRLIRAHRDPSVLPITITQKPT